MTKVMTKVIGKVMNKKSRNFQRHHELNNWTQSALDCYEIGATCRVCPYRKEIKKNCHMKDKIIEIVRIYGKPYDRLNNFIGDTNDYNC